MNKVEKIKRNKDIIFGELEHEFLGPGLSPEPINFEEIGHQERFKDLLKKLNLTIEGIKNNEILSKSLIYALEDYQVYAIREFADMVDCSDEYYFSDEFETSVKQDARKMLENFLEKETEEEKQIDNNEEEEDLEDLEP